MDFAREEAMEYEGDGNTNCSGSLETIPKGLLKRLEDLEIRVQVETTQATALLRTARILRRVLEIEETCYHSNSR